MTEVTSGDLTALTVVAIGATLAALPQFLPRLSDVHPIDPESDDARHIRVGEVAAGGFFVAVGVVAAGMAGSHKPVTAAMLLALFVIVVYEVTLRGDFFRGDDNASS